MLQRRVQGVPDEQNPEGRMMSRMPETVAEMGRLMSHEGMTGGRSSTKMGRTR
jgi:hypothetical protein